MDLSSSAFLSLYTDDASYARMGTRRLKISEPKFLESVGWKATGLTRSVPKMSIDGENDAYHNQETK